MRVSALSHIPSIWVWTHDSIGLGEDGPTHQPVEQLAALRAMPGLMLIRPADANETSEAWKVAIHRRNGPTALVLTRQACPVLDRSQYAPASGLQKGAYVLADLGKGKPQLILMASGSEVGLIVEAGQKLAEENIAVRLVSFPSWELFEGQSEAYQEEVLLPDVTKRLAVEAGVSMGWERWLGSEGKMIGLNHFGASVPYKTLFEKFGFTVANVVEQARDVLGK